MTTDGGFTGGQSQLFTQGELQFILNREIRRAARSHAVLTLIVVRVERDTRRRSRPPDEQTIEEVGRLIARDLREHDVIGYLEPGLLALVLPHADYARAQRLIDRLASRIETYAFHDAVRVVLGAACHPTHATAAAPLKRWAASHPIVTCRGRSRSARVEPRARKTRHLF